jgi:N-acetylneuraminic acid mutarotase
MERHKNSSPDYPSHYFWTGGILKLQLVWYKTIFSTLCLVILVAGCTSGPAWVRKADLPTGRVMQSVAAVNGKIYVLGGFEGNPEARMGSRKVEVYTPSTNTWVKKADMLTGRGSLASVEVAGKIYVMGGSPGAAFPPVAAAEVYDPALDSWSKLPDMQEALDGATASLVDGKVFVIGGTQYDSLTQERISISTVEEYDPETKTWVKKTDMPTPRYALSSCVINGKIYVIGGMISTFQMVTPVFATKAVEVYDPQTDTWTKKADMPAPRADAALAVLNGKIYIFGGTETDDGSATSTIFVYDPDLDQWTTSSSMPFKRLALSASMVDGRIYILGGSAESFPKDLPDLSLWEYLH